MKILEGRKAEKVLAKKAMKLNVGGVLIFREIKFPGESVACYMFYLGKEKAIKLTWDQIDNVLKDQQTGVQFVTREFPMYQTIAVSKFEG